MTSSKGRTCSTCAFYKEAKRGPNCGPCFEEEDPDGDMFPRWQHASAFPLLPPKAPCGGLMCHDPACTDCFGFKIIEAAKADPKMFTPQPPAAPNALPENPKAIHGRTKPPLGLFPSAALIECAGVFRLGAEKYGQANWRKDPVESMTYVNAALRHLFSWLDGNATDAESGQSELAHAICCFAIILDAEANGKLIDDRPHKGVAAALIASKTTPLT